MTPADAVKVLRKYEAEATEGWPYGYDRATVQRECGAAVTVLSEATEAAPDPGAMAREYLTQLTRRAPYTATVPLKKRGGT
ncbi:MAG TPA: hypothetical protein DCQ64_26150 [Candidatus Rokubacteria bacterium]|nr:hypothetical protein [Candidatus Rokubacteria bacterium]